ncbi:MAG: hypothetical protein ABQ298_03740 [Puniceicoccaceae bacterium]
MSEIQRGARDELLVVSKAYPAAGASSVTASIDLGVLAGGEVPKGAEFFVKFPASTTLVATKKATATVQSSNDDGDSDSFAAVAELANKAITGVSGNGNAETIVYWPVPLDCERYARLSMAIEAAGGDLTALSYEFGVICNR